MGIDIKIAKNSMLFQFVLFPELKAKINEAVNTSFLKLFKIAELAEIKSRQNGKYLAQKR